MKSEKLKLMLLPLGLFWMAGVPFVEHLMKIELPDFANGFSRGIGLGLIVSTVILQKFARSRNLR